MVDARLGRPGSHPSGRHRPRGSPLCTQLSRAHASGFASCGCTVWSLLCLPVAAPRAWYLPRAHVDMYISTCVVFRCLIYISGSVAQLVRRLPGHGVGGHRGPVSHLFCALFYLMYLFRFFSCLCMDLL